VGIRDREVGTGLTVAARSAMQLVLKVGEDIGCDAQDFYL
jgi:hypothetical protein